MSEHSKSDNNQINGFTHENNQARQQDHQSQSAPQTPAAMQPNTNIGNSSRYSGFFLVMLILASVVAFFSLFGSIFSIIAIVGYVVTEDYMLALITALSPIINLLSLIALALLWFKKSAGLYLKFATLFLAVILAGASTYTVFDSNTFKDEIRNSSYEDSTNSLPEPSKQDLETDQKIEDFFTSKGAPVALGAAALIGSLVWNSGAGALWFFAWRSQKKHDANSATPTTG